MKKVSAIGVVILTICLVFSISFAATNKVGTTAAQFLKIGVGSRAIAMGGAFVATADDATAIFWNPAGLAKLEHNEVALVHTEWLAETNFEFGSLVIPLGGGNTIGAFITMLDYGEWERTTVEQPNGTGEMFGATDLAIGVTYARQLTDRFSFGINAKYIDQNIWHMNASGFALDVGTLFVTQFKNLRIGMNFSNFGGKLKMQGKDLNIFNHSPDGGSVDLDNGLDGNNEQIPALLETASWDIPLQFRVGVAMDVVEHEYSKVTVGIDAITPNDNLEYVNMGFEWGMKDMIFLRSGYKSLFRPDTEEGLTLGGGLKFMVKGIATLQVDYAYADFGRLENSHRFSLGIQF